jgi:hypothetical protein
MNNSNPLQNFFRKPKFTITLPSRGKWYPNTAQNIISSQGEVEVYAMTAADDTRFKTSEVLVSHTATYDLIKSCIPSIKDPENMPIVDLDAAILGIRRASYGDQLELEVPVPNTNLKHKLNLSIQELTNQMPDASEVWDSELIIQDGDQQLTLTLAPIYLKTLFNTTKQLIKQQQISQKMIDGNQSNDEKIAELDNQMKSLGNINVNVVIDSIRNISSNDGFSTNNANEIRQFVTQIDLEYFRAIMKHLDEQKKKVGFRSVTVVSNADQLSAGAPESWQAEVTFVLSNFFA